MTRPASRLAVRLCALAGLAALAACSSTPTSFYTLGTGTLAGTAASATLPADPAFLIDLRNVTVPTQVTGPQFVINRGQTQVDVLEQTRWAAPLADEIRGALGLALQSRLGTLDVSAAGAPAGRPVYRISVDVKRFESWPGQRTVLDTVWSLRVLEGQPVMTCHTLASEPVGAGYDALVAGHRQAVEQLATDIAAGVRALRAQGAQSGAALSCPSSGAAVPST
jgi:uncharacterized protein